VFVRKTRSSSGAVTVQVMRKVNGRDVVVAHVGSAHSDADLGILFVLGRIFSLRRGRRGSPRTSTYH
jgi:hypothetical protein